MKSESTYITENLDAYEQGADGFIAQYESCDAAEFAPRFYADMTACLNPGDLDVLDLGCGPGRDSFCLADAGFHVVGVDGSQSFISRAHRQSEGRISPNPVFLCDLAPELIKTRALSRNFDIIFLNAFLFHLNEMDRYVLYDVLSGLMKNRAYLYATLRRGPDCLGRNMFDVPIEEMESFAIKGGFQIEVAERGMSDFFGREGVSWDHVILRREW